MRIGVSPIDVVGAEPSQGRVDLLGDLHSGPALVGVRHLAAHLGGEDVGVAGMRREDLAPRRLGHAAAVHVGSVEEVDPSVERGLGADAGLLGSRRFARVGS